MRYPETERSERQSQLLASSDPYCLASACVTCGLLSRLGRYREDYAYGEDTDMIIRLRLMHADLTHCVEEALYMRRIHQHNISISHERMTRESYMKLWTNAIRKQTWEDGK